MDSAINRALAGLLIHVDRVCSCTYLHLTVPIKPLVGALLILYTIFMDMESVFLVVVSMGIMLLDFVQRFPFAPTSKHEAVQDNQASKVPHPESKRKATSSWDINLDPETASLDKALADVCETVFGRALSTSPKTPTCKLIALGPALLEPAPKLGRVLGAIARIATEHIPGAKVYGFERTSASPGYPGGSMEVVVVVPCPQLVEQLGDRLQRGIRGGHLMLTTAQLHKSALRYLIDYLVSGGFKFRCSAFKAQEPMVALSAPFSLSGGNAAYVTLSVNNPLPFLEAALTQQASVSDARAVPLIAAVQRWAEARGLSHPVFGPLTMYGWVHTCLFFLIHHAQPRMPHLVMDPKRKGFLESSAECRPLDSHLLEKFFDFVSKFAFGRNHMWLGESIGPGAPFIEDALRPGIDLGFHLQHKLPRKQIQAEAALAASALQNQTATVDTLTELSPVKIKTPGSRTQISPAADSEDLRIMKKVTIQQQKREDEVSELTRMLSQRAKKKEDDEVIETCNETPPPFPSTIPDFAKQWGPPHERQIPPWRERDDKATDGAKSPSTKPPSEVDTITNDVDCSSSGMSD